MCDADVVVQICGCNVPDFRAWAEIIYMAWGVGFEKCGQ